MNATTRAVTITRQIDAPPGVVWDVLADGWLYTSWVVGAARMRAVDDSWPDVGARLHHSVGGWPLLLDDKTEVLASDPGRTLRLKAHTWPFGAAEVLLEIEPAGSGTCVRISEDAVEGPARLLPRPLRQLALGPRNVEGLRRLAFLVERR